MNKSIKFTLIIILAISLIAVLIVEIIALNYSISQLDVHLQKVVQESVETEIESRLQDAVVSMSNTIETYYSNHAGKVSDKKLFQNIVQMVNDARYSTDGYFLLIEFDGRLRASAGSPELVGRNILNVTYEESNKPIQQLINNAKNGGGFARYIWKNPTTGQNEAKITYSKTVKLGTHELAIGTGAYLPRVEAARGKIAKQISAAKKDTLILALLSTVPFSLVIIGLTIIFINKSIISPIISLSEGTEEIAKGNLSKRLIVSTSNEIGQLAKKFNSMAESLSYMICEREQAQAALAASEEKFSKAFRYSAEVIGINRLNDGCFIEINEAFTNIFGYSREEVIEHSSEEIGLWHEPGERTKIYKILETEKSFRNIETLWRAKSGKIFIGLCSAEVIEIGGTECILFVWNDITERKQTEEKLRQARDELEIQVEKRTLELKKANEELQEISSLDGLTGVANRRCLDEFLDQEWQKGQQQCSPIAIIMLDLDFFKGYNDAYGHQAGDECLKLVATALKSALKWPTGLVARFGGEEFVIVLPNTNIESAALEAEEIRTKIENLSIKHEKSLISPVVTVSLGVTAIDPCQEIPSTAIAAADHALYQAKHEGRNRVKIKYPNT